MATKKKHMVQVEVLVRFFGPGQRWCEKGEKVALLDTQANALVAQKKARLVPEETKPAPTPKRTAAGGTGPKPRRKPRKRAEPEPKTEAEDKD